MPQQETCLRTEIRGRRIEVLKTYDQAFAREAFSLMDKAALDHLSGSLHLSNNYDETDIPSATDEGFGDFIWDEVIDSAREDGNLCSFFLVIESNAFSSNPVFVSSDWPTAQAYVKLMGEAEFATQN